MSSERRTYRLPGTLRTRLFIAFTLLTLLISGAFTAVEIFNEISIYRKETAARAELLAENLAIMVRLPLFAGNIPDVSARTSDIAHMRGVHKVSIRDATGHTVVELSFSGEATSESYIRGEARISPGDFGPSVEQITGNASGATQALGTATVEMNRSELDKQIRSLIASATITGLFFLVLFISVAWLIVRWATTSLEPLVQGVKAMHAGNYSTRIDTGSRDEFADASLAINELAEALQLRQEENVRLQQELLDSMKNEVREERRKMMAKLIQTNRMTSLGLLVSGVAHEINTPNGAIRLAGQKFERVWNNAQAILDRVACDEGDFVLGGISYDKVRIEVANSLQLINRCTDRVDQVVKELRQFSIGEQSQTLDTVDINSVVNNALSIITAHRQIESITIDRQMSVGIPPVIANKYQLAQVITNLVLNAMQAIPEGISGAITVLTLFDDTNGMVTVEVMDNGEGIPEDIRNRLMEPFFTTRIEKGGSGLGLYISSYIIAEHNGTLSFESTAGSGTTFTLRLPAAT